MRTQKLSKNITENKTQWWQVVIFLPLISFGFCFLALLLVWFAKPDLSLATEKRDKAAELLEVLEYFEVANSLKSVPLPVPFCQNETCFAQQIESGMLIPDGKGGTILLTSQDQTWLPTSMWVPSTGYQIQKGYKTPWGQTVIFYQIPIVGQKPQTIRLSLSQPQQGENYGTWSSTKFVPVSQ